MTGDKKSVTIQLMKRQDPEAVIERAPLDSKGNISLHVTDL